MQFSNIKLVVVDCDGTLTDGIYQVSSSGSIVKSFYTRDFYALESLMDNNIKVLILTQSGDECIQHRINEIIDKSSKWSGFAWTQLLEIATQVDNKLEYMRSHIQTFTLQDNVAYIGDSNNDIEIMKECLFTGCPSDAIEKVKNESNYISNFPGGKGAVYDFGMHILDKIKRGE